MERTGEVLFLLQASAPATGVKATIPLVESLAISEFGVYNGVGANNTSLSVVRLELVDSTAGGATVTTLGQFTLTNPLNQGVRMGRRCDYFVDKLNNIAFGTGTSSTDVLSQLSPSASTQFVALNLSVATANFTAATVVTFYIRYRKCGSSSTAVTGETFLTV